MSKSEERGSQNILSFDIDLTFEFWNLTFSLRLH